MQATVFRGAGDRQGPDIVDPLLVTDQVAVARGRREIDRESSDRELVNCQCPRLQYLPPGSVVDVMEARRRWRGMVRYWSLTLTLDDGGRRYTVDTRLTIEREVDHGR